MLEKITPQLAGKREAKVEKKDKEYIRLQEESNTFSVKDLDENEVIFLNEALENKVLLEKTNFEPYQITLLTEFLKNGNNAENLINVLAPNLPDLEVDSVVVRRNIYQIINFLKHTNENFKILTAYLKNEGTN